MDRQIDSPIDQCGFKLANKNSDAQCPYVQTLIFIAGCLDNDDLELNVRIRVFERVNDVAGLRQGKFAPASTYLDEARHIGRTR
jgi:hypothetical protein